MLRRLPLAALALPFLLAPAAAAQPLQMGNFEIQDLVISIEWSAPRGASPATVRVTGLPERGPTLEALVLSPTDAPGRRGRIQLRRAEGGAYVGTGRAPSREDVRSLGLLTDDGTLVLATGALVEGNATISASTGRTRRSLDIDVEVSVDCCPLEVVITIEV